MLSAIFDAAVDDRLIVAPPCRRMTLPKPSAERVDPPTIEQVGALADAMGRYGAAVILLAGSGLRIGELVGLRVEDIDFPAA